jgi:hypothetical protein
MREAYAIYARKFLPRVYPQDSYRGGGAFVIYLQSFLYWT